MSPAFGNYFPGITINDAGDAAMQHRRPPAGPLYGLVSPSLAIGPDAEYQGANTGVFQNRIMPSGTAIWAKGTPLGQLRRQLVLYAIEYARSSHRHGQCGHTGFCHLRQQLGHALLHAESLRQPRSCRATPTATSAPMKPALFVQDKFQVMPTLSITAGVRYDWNGGLTEKNGNIFNFDPSQYSYDAATDTITSSGFIIAGNNENGTKGVSKTTLTGRQWGIAPGFGFAWQPSIFHSKFVVRGGSGFYYDRGELFTYLSPGYAAGEIDGGPFGASQTEPFVSQQHCPYSSSYQRRQSNLSLPVLRPHLRRQRARGHRRQLAITIWPRPGATRSDAALEPQSLRHLQLPAQRARHHRRYGLRQQRRSAVHSGRLQPGQQAALQHQFHAQHSVPAAQRPDGRDRIRGQSRPPPSDSRSL